MNLKEDKVIGIVGGMGPQAGLSLFNYIINHTKAVTDQQHLSVIVMSFPGHLTDRTSFLEGATDVNPAFNIAEVIGKLEHAGAKVAGIACNTSYSPEIYDVIVDELRKMNSRVNLLHMPAETCDFIRINYPKVCRIGLMATNGTYRSGIYANLLRDRGYEVILPDPEFQTSVIHRMIYDDKFGIKANPGGVTREVGLLVDKALCFFEEKGTDAIILGCTDLSTVFPEKIARGMLLVDSTEVLARALIRQATHHQKKNNANRNTADILPLRDL